MKDVVVFKTNDFEKFLNNVIENSFELGISYIEKESTFTKEEMIKMIQDKVWNGIATEIEKM